MKSTLTEEYIRQKYCREKWRPSRIAKDCGKAINTVHRALRAYGIPIDRERLRRAYNHTFFDQWSPDMAYILAFITCDGYVRVDKRGYGTLTIEVQADDVSVLEFIKSRLGPTARIRYRERVDKRSGYLSRMVSVVFCSQPMVKSLIRLGVIPAKTGKETLPQVPEEMRPHYLRGLIDGDGYIGLTYRKTNGYLHMFARIGIASASKVFLESARDAFFDGRASIALKSNKGCYSLEVYSRKTIIRVLSQAYKGGFCLKRKRDRYSEVVRYDKAMATNARSKACYQAIDKGSRHCAT